MEATSGGFAVLRGGGRTRRQRRRARRDIWSLHRQTFNRIAKNSLRAPEDVRSILCSRRVQPALLGPPFDIPVGREIPAHAFIALFKFRLQAARCLGM